MTKYFQHVKSMEGDVGGTWESRGTFMKFF